VHSPYDSGQAAFYHSLMFSDIIRCGEMFTPFSSTIMVITNQFFLT